MKKEKSKGRLTLPSEENFLEETKRIMEDLGADALRDSDGTKLPDEMKDLDAQIYTTYFVAREDNAFAKKHLDERVQFYLMSERVTATSSHVEIPYAKGYFDQQIEPDLDHDPKKYWQLYDRTEGKALDPGLWDLDKEGKKVCCDSATPYHEYTVNFLAYAAWDTTSMYNHITNDWGDREHQIPFNAMGEKASSYMEDRLDRWLTENPKTDIVRFTTFFYHFTLVFNDLAKEKFVDWFGYSASVSTEALAAFEKEKGYALTAEDFVDEGYYNSPFRLPSGHFLDYMDFLSKFVCEKAGRLVEIVHKHGRKAVMFLGDNWIGTEPYGKYFSEIGLDGVVGSVGDGVTLRLISDIPHVRFTEGRFLPYFFPDTFHPGNDPSREARQNWLNARRAILRNPVDRIGYGGYLSLANQFPKFMKEIGWVADEYRDMMDRIDGHRPACTCRVAILNAWGELRRWQPYIVAHGKWYQRCYSYMGMMEALAGMDVDVSFLSFREVLDHGIDPGIDVLINAGDARTAWSGGSYFDQPDLVEKIRAFVAGGGGLIGVGEPSAYLKQGRYFQLADILGVDREMGFSQSTNRYNVEEQEHFITEEWSKDNELGEPVSNLFAIDEDTKVLCYRNHSVVMACREYGKGRSFYVSGLAYSPENSRLLKRAILFTARKEEAIRKYWAEDPQVEVAVYPEIGQYAIFNNSNRERETTFLDGQGREEKISLGAGEIIWREERGE